MEFPNLDHNAKELPLSALMVNRHSWKILHLIVFFVLSLPVLKYSIKARLVAMSMGNRRCRWYLDTTLSLLQILEVVFFLVRHPWDAISACKEQNDIISSHTKPDPYTYKIFICPDPTLNLKSGV